jgi:hypothetical protein
MGSARETFIAVNSEQWVLEGCPYLDLEYVSVDSADYGVLNDFIT